MTTTFGVDKDNDLYLGTGNNIVVNTGLEAVMLACKTATLAQLGEMILFNQQGIPTFQTVWVGTPNYSLFTSYLRSTLIAVDGVLEVVTLDLRSVNDVLLYTATIKTVFGTGELNGGLSIS